MSHEPWTPERADQLFLRHQQAAAAERNRRRVNLSKLSDSQKRKVWEHIKATNPALAETLRSPCAKAIVDLFQAEVYVDAQILIGVDGLTLGALAPSDRADTPS